MAGVDILIGNNLPLYREVLATMFQAVASELDILSVSDQDLDAEVARLRPCVVICSTVSAAIMANCAAWIQLFPDQRDEAIVGIVGEQRVLPHAGVSELLKVYHEARPRCEQSPERGM